ncbi:YfhO family protein [Dorea longicatena]|uniref:YfhO family protein n=1 Tax=Dorea longicatena TaxID=88431 RepID=UPI001D011C5D|nr:YfhO family protein [Dorea longicatena]MCB5534902.1 YfhO family protein [bacterium MSK17_88]MCB5545266.1 YfhO family protein [Dorea longicatena]MCG4573214.1 YfhO family protein [Dorea longicatena]
MDKVKRYIPYLLLTGLTLFFCRMFVGRYGIFGAKVDWLSQHSVLPDYFRQQFYATGKLFPEFAANLGGGQNIYHFAYYGLYSPLILPSYLLPFVKMSDYIMAVSITGLTASVLLFYYWLKSRKTDTGTAFILSLMFLLAGPMIGQYSGQIMFVDYMPFLCLALIGVDRYFEQEKSGLFTVSVFLMIMTSFYFSIGGMLSLVLYGLHRYFEQREGNRGTVRSFLRDGLCFVRSMILAVLMSGFFLVPTALALTGGRSKEQNTSFVSFFIPQITVERFAYSIYGIGLTTLVITVLLTGLLYRKVYEKVLTYGCVIVLVIPVFAYLLNGGLYIRDKVFIPFLPLLCYLISIYLEKCRKRELSFIAGIVPYIITTIFVYIARNQFVSKGIGKSIWKVLLAESILFLICYVLYCALKRYHKETKEILMLALPSVICLAVTMNTFYQMKPDRYVSRKLYRDVVEEQNRQAVKEALKDDDGYYRTEQMGSDDENAADLNRIWDVDQNITSIYSSAYNPDYQTFRQKTFGLEEPFRNGMMQSVSKNPVFQRMMGVRYIVSDSDVPGYTLVKKCGTTGIYQNEDAAPVMYATDRVMTEEEYKKLTFPYNQTAFLEYAVVGEHTESSDQNIMTAYEPVSLKMANNRTTGGAEQKTIQQEGQKQILFLRFRVYNAHPNKDVAVWINGIRNKLSAKDHVYYNENKIFTYAVPLKDGEDNISVTFGKGKYRLRHVQAYLGSLPERSELLYQSEIQVDKKQTEDNVIQGTIRVKKDGWFITSIPYDKHFKIYIDGKETEIQKVNTAFLGCKIESGNHELKIIYHAPGTTGKVLSLIGIAGFVLVLVQEKRKQKNNTR